MDTKDCAICGTRLEIKDYEVARPWLYEKRVTCGGRCRSRWSGMQRRKNATQRRYEQVQVRGQVPLTNSVPMIALVDEEDFDRVMQYPWHAHQAPDSDRWYATTHIAGKSVLMHRFILDAKPGELVDHWSRDGLDNRQGNLRRATPSQNSTNRRVRTGTISGFKGVVYHAQSGRWAVQLKVAGKVRRFGLYDDPVDAAHVYDTKAREVHGEFARLNFPRDGEQAA